MTPEDFEAQLVGVAQTQRKAGWSEESIRLYAEEQRATVGGCLEGVVAIGAGLACDNTRFGVLQEPTPLTLNPEAVELAESRRLLGEVFADSGFRNLYEPLQDQIEAFLNPRQPW